MNKRVIGRRLRPTKKLEKLENTGYQKPMQNLTKGKITYIF